jgi:hypothetical protein
VSDTDGFFEDQEAGVPREKGQPLIAQLNGTRLAYTRASSLGDYIAETEFLHRWKLRYLARQLGKNEDLAALAGLETYSTGFDEDSVTKSASGKRLDDIIDRALDRGRIIERADYGTVVHAITEPGNEGYVPVRAAIDRHAFWECIELNDIDILGTELFTVNDRWKVAGTFDHLIRTKEYGVCIADKKNGRNINGLGFSVQFVSYADGELYDYRVADADPAGARTPLTSLTGGEPINPDVAILFEVKDGKCKPREVDISRGREAAEVAAKVRDMRAWNGMANISKKLKSVPTSKTATPAFRTRAIIRRIEEAVHPEELRGIWYQYGKDDWNDELTAAAKAKKEREGWA